MATIESIMSGARTYMRDFPKYFTASVPRNGTPRVFHLPHLNVSPQEMFVEGVGATSTLTGVLKNSASVEPTELSFTYTLDVREGLLKIVDPPTTQGWGDVQYFNIDGYYHEWVATGDLRFAAEVVIAEHGDSDPNFTVNDLGDAHADLVSLGTAIEVCWALLFQYSRDIDVNTPEAIGLPLTQRYGQVERLLSSVLEKYKTKSNMLGVGLEKITVGQLRRQSRSINRLVPIYLPREWDDASFPVRLFPPITQTDPSTPPEEFTPARAITGYYEEIKPYTDVTANP